MAISFVVLYNCLARGLIVQPSGPLYLPQAEDKLAQSMQLVGPDVPTSSALLQMLSCLYGVGQIPGISQPSTDIYADRRISFGSVDDFNQNGLETDDQIVSGYQDFNRKPSASADAEFLSGYLVTTSAPPAQRLPALHTAKRNCHIIKCPKFCQATYGSDGSRCHEFLNPCFLAVASCKRHNNRLPRLKEVSKKQCDTLIRKI